MPADRRSKRLAKNLSESTIGTPPKRDSLAFDSSTPEKRNPRGSYFQGSDDTCESPAKRQKGSSHVQPRKQERVNPSPHRHIRVLGSPLSPSQSVQSQSVEEDTEWAKLPQISPIKSMKNGRMKAHAQTPEVPETVFEYTSDEMRSPSPFPERRQSTPSWNRAGISSDDHQWYAHVEDSAMSPSYKVTSPSSPQDSSSEWVPSSSSNGSATSSWKDIRSNLSLSAEETSSRSSIPTSVSSDTGSYHPRRHVESLKDGARPSDSFIRRAPQRPRPYVEILVPVNKNIHLHTVPAVRTSPVYVSQTLHSTFSNASLSHHPMPRYHSLSIPEIVPPLEVGGQSDCETRVDADDSQLVAGIDGLHLPPVGVELSPLAVQQKIQDIDSRILSLVAEKVELERRQEGLKVEIQTLQATKDSLLRGTVNNRR